MPAGKGTRAFISAGLYSDDIAVARAAAFFLLLLRPVYYGILAPRGRARLTRRRGTQEVRPSR